MANCNSLYFLARASRNQLVSRPAYLTTLATTVILMLASPLVISIVQRAAAPHLANAAAAAAAAAGGSSGAATAAHEFDYHKQQMHTRRSSRIDFYANPTDNDGTAGGASLAGDKDKAESSGDEAVQLLDDSDRPLRHRTMVV
jgi:K+-transporting ATPase c subunit